MEWRCAIRIGLIQQTATTDKQKNLQTGLRNLAAAADQGAELVCFSELAFEPFYPQHPASGNVAKLAEAIPGPVTEAFQELAAARGVVVVLNLFEHSGDLCFDSSPVIDADGSLLGVTRMIHITEYSCFHERGYYHPGDTGAPVYNTRIGKIGVAICYDRHYPEYMRALGLGGAEVVLVPQAGVVGEWPDGLFEAELRIAAFQNGYFTALCNRVGKEEKLDFAGESFLCDPSGRVLARAPSREETILCADLDLAAVEDSHARRLFLRHRRPELYARWLEKSARSLSE